MENKKIDGIVIDPETKKIIYEGGWGNDTYDGQGILKRKVNN